MIKKQFQKKSACPSGSEGIKVLLLTAELAPIAKVGGLADVAGALPKALVQLGVDIRICLPFYGLIDTVKFKPKKILENIEVHIDNKVEKISAWKMNLPGTKIPVFLIKHKYFNYKKIYCGKRIMHGNKALTQNNSYTCTTYSCHLYSKNPSKYPDTLHNFSKKSDINLCAKCKSYFASEPKYSRGADDIKRFAFFSIAALEVARSIDFVPDVIHAQDWHTALVSDYLKTINKKEDDFFAQTKTLYTIHNLANQGIADTDVVSFAGIDPNLKTIQDDQKDGDINFMVQGILSSDLINTVSKCYAKEILHYYQGAGLDNILKKREKDLYGILNGIDTDFFNPEKDKFIYKKYSLKTLEKKQENKIFLQKKLGLWPDKNIALVGLVSRLVWQKGIELISDDFANLNCQFVFLGTGQKEYEKHLLALAKKYPHQFSAKIMFDVKLAQQIYASSDIFLMPSRFEPCGLGQMIAMRYGTVPVVRKTGGLADTVFDFKSGSRLQKKFSFLNSELKKANGFSFKNFNSKALYKVLDRALDVYYNSPKQWHKLQANGMCHDFSWSKSAREYLELYNKLR